MVRLETSLLDKFVNKMALGKRQLGRPHKFNLRNASATGFMELVFHPRNSFELYLSKAWRIAMPYLGQMTYQFHVKEARDGGFRIMDQYHNKFWKEPYIQMHLFAQYFHPHSYQERIRQCAAYRRPKILFKGYRVPDWAQAQNRGGYDYDWASRKAWNNAMHDLRSEWTPMQFTGQRQDPNLINWFRLEHYGHGMSSKLFYNEVPKPTWYRHKGHLDDIDREVFSFTHAD